MRPEHFILWALVFLFGCADHKPPVEEARTPYFSEYHYPVGLTFDEVVETAYLKCADDCNQNVGMLLVSTRSAAGEKIFGRCTGTLVAEDIVLTADHCVPDEARKPGASCGDFLAFIAPSSPAWSLAPSVKRSKCRRIVHTSNPQKAEADPDYALIQLSDKLSDAPEPFSRSGFGDRMVIDVRVVDPDGEYPLGGIQKKKSCQTFYQTVFALDFIDPWAPRIPLFGQDCQLIGGNSGAPIFSETGFILGVVTQGRRTSADQQILAGKDRNIGAATNLACLDLKAVGPPVTQTCLQVNPRSRLLQAQENFKNRFDEELLDFLRPTLTQYAGMRFDVSLYEESPPDDIQKVTRDLVDKGEQISVVNIVFKPTCIHTLDKWFYMPIDSRPLRPRDEGFQIGIPFIVAKRIQKIDGYGRLSVEFSLAHQANVPISIDLEKVGTAENAVVSRAPQLFPQLPKTFRINWCANGEAKTVSLK